MSCLSNETSKKYCLIEDFVLKRRTFSIFNITLRNILAVKSSKHGSTHDEFYFVGFAHVRNSYVFRF